VTTLSTCADGRPTKSANERGGTKVQRALRGGLIRLRTALGGKSRHCNNFGSWYKRRGERIDIMPGFD
jgi:hypothetical protein